MTKLSSILKKLINRQRISLTELSRRTGIVQPVLYRMASGETKDPKIETLRPIAKYFEVSLDQLIGDDTLDSAEQSGLAKQTALQHIPIIPWNQLTEFATLDRSEQKTIICQNIVNSKSFATIMPDTTMEPLFTQKSTLIFDPDKPIKDRSYALIVLHETNTPIFRQILIDADHKYLKALNQDFTNFQLRLLHKLDTILGVLIESRANHDST